MYYLVYKTINLINGKFYIGKHQTDNLDDGYQGSGLLLRRALKKYGNKNFVTSILGIFDQEWKMNIAERVLVIVDNEVSYNICNGGKGGFGYLNSHKNFRLWKTNNASKSNGPITEEGKLRYHIGCIKGGFLSRDMMKGIHSKDFVNVGGGFTGKKHSPKTIEKMKKSKKGQIPWNIGIPRSEETKRRIKDSMKKYAKS